jgi:predicted DNA-binding transcriptional regulator AlpA
MLIGQDRLLTALEVAEWLGPSVTWVHHHASGGRRPILPSVKLGKAVRFRRAHLEKFIGDNTR